ncbi:uncharacterized protein Dwil_GK11755 [Drosophila willistoni]|uniref:Uncharacterized protein n=1 Tax=Drosophila willistoni TaxID=7260 RepID=B4NAP8_DROWI|nr:uncharacterized protein Dwil_GK11755 [Drosophila willistoni]
MLERVDEQTAIMSQRSERLKMMKLQYQMYFAKLVQNQTLRCIQHTQVPPGVVAAAGVGMGVGVGVGGGNMATIPVILQPQANAGQATTAGGVTGQPWTFAAMPFGQPQQAVLTPQFATPTTTATQPIYYPELYGGVPLATSNLFDLRATLRAFDNENADLPDRMATRFNMEAASEALTGDYRPEPLPTTVATPTTTASSSDTGRDKGVRQLSSTSSTLATSSLTFDKLPKTSSPTLTLTELPPATGFTPGPGSSFGPGSGQPQMPPHSDRLEEHNQQQQQAAWTNSRVTKVEHEKSPNVVGHNEQPAGLGPGQQHQQQQPQSNNFQAYFSEMKIDEPTEDKRELNVRTGMGTGMGMGMGMGTTRPTELGISNDLLEEVKASRAALEMAAAAVDEQLARGNQLSPPSAGGGGGGLMDELKPEARLSIENIENAIYGERLTAAAATHPPPTQGLLENLVTNKRTSEKGERERERNAADTAVAGLAEPLDYGQYETAGYSEPMEPIYASIDSNQQPAVEAVPTPAAAAAGATVEPLYSEIGNPTDYQQYGAEGNAAASVAAETAASEASVSAQEYSNIDYGNYETDQYAAAGYDPNAYPGYIYDEATGQYIADPNAGPYAADGSYAGQEYDANVANYDYNAYAEQQQQQQQQQQLLGEQQEGYPMTENTNNQLQTEMESSQPPATTTPPAIATPTNSNEATVSSPPVAASKPPVKPTSILSSTDKQVPTNDAQQQLKKKKRVNFVDSSETDDSSSAKPAPPVAVTPSSSASPSASAATGAAPSQPAPVQAPASASTPVMEGGAGVTAAGGTGAGSESDFDFSTGSEAKN